jgi:hypothetical protein
VAKEIGFRSFAMVELLLTSVLSILSNLDLENIRLIFAIITGSHGFQSLFLVNPITLAVSVLNNVRN